MKKIIISVIAIIISAIVVFFLIYLSFFGMIYCSFHGKPTIKMVRNDLSDWYNIALPENVTLEEYASNIGPPDRQYYVVLEYEGDDEEFNSIFSYEENTSVLAEYYFNEHRYQLMQDFSKNFSIPSFDNDYGWLIKKRDEEHPDRCAILYFYNLNKLVVFIDDY